MIKNRVKLAMYKLYNSLKKLILNIDITDKTLEPAILH